MQWVHIAAIALLVILLIGVIYGAYWFGRIYELLKTGAGGDVGDKVWVRNCEICGTPASSLKINVNAEQISSVFLCEECLVDGLQIEHQSE